MPKELKKSIYKRRIKKRSWYYKLKSPTTMSTGLIRGIHLTHPKAMQRLLREADCINTVVLEFREVPND